MPEHPKPRSVLERENKMLRECIEELESDIENERRLRMEAERRSEGYRIERDRLLLKQQDTP